MSRVAPFLAVLLAAGLLAGCGGGSSKKSSTQNGCQVIGSPPKSSSVKQPKPTQDLSPTNSYVVTMQTNCGSFSFKIDQKQSPHASASFVQLVQNGFFNDTVFHRIVPDFVIQGGDPTGTGTGGPGYETVDKPPASAAYKHGTVAMAKTASEPAGTAGSQFFVVTAMPATQLPPDYAIIGQVTDGIDVVDLIGRQGSQDGTPSQIVEIEKASVAIK
jgi:cyclophilin family peptidyl-prolyl cis-trans isomerase